MKTALITGANSGLGLESARQLAVGGGGWTRILLTARSQQKGETARADLVSSTGRPESDFGILVFDLTDDDSIRAAVAGLDEGVDAVVMNGGGMGAVDDAGLPRLTAQGLTQTFSMNVGGHAVLVRALLDRDLLRDGATVLFVGSEASRGIKPMRLKSPTLPEGQGDLDATLQAVASGSYAGKGFDNMTDYGLVKLLGTAWMSHLQQEHGTRLRALTVSPGMTSGTAATKDLPGFQKFMFTKVLFPLFGLMGHAHDLQTGAARYVEVLESDAFEGGSFYASKGQGITGPLVPQSAQHQPLLDDSAFQAAVARLIDTRIAPTTASTAA